MFPEVVEARGFRETEVCSAGTRGSVRVHQLGESVGSTGTVGWAARRRASVGDLGIDLVQGSVPVFEDVVLVVEFSEALGQGQLMSMALVNPEGELPRCELSGEHASCEGSGGGFLTGLAADRIE
ncbi:hypothetical protein [Streptomyces sp. NPDC015130]|uniref:hypothetical protein n=1 Tax=Streptomyces sp. NPDC015130 TaxID=3364940 RepID=UPI0036FC3C9E